MIVIALTVYNFISLAIIFFISIHILLTNYTLIATILSNFIILQHIYILLVTVLFHFYITDAGSEFKVRMQRPLRLLEIIFYLIIQPPVKFIYFTFLIFTVFINL